MTNSDAKKCLSERTPVVWRGIRYDRISAIIYRVEKNELVVKVELTDQNANSVTIADVKDVSEVIKI